MKIQTKLQISLGLVMAISLGAFMFWAQASLKEDLLQIEQVELHSHQERLIQAISTEFDADHQNIVDYARWNVAESFIQSPNTEFIKENFGPETPMNLGIHLIALLKDGKLVFSQESQSLSPATEGLSLASLKALDHSGYESRHNLAWHRTTLHQAGGRLLVLTGMSIQNEDGSGSNRGVLVFGKYLNQNFAQNLSQKLQNPTQIYMGEGLKRALIQMEGWQKDSALNDFAYEIQSDSLLRFRQIYRDLQGQALWIVEMSFNRQTMQKSEELIRHLSYGFVGLAVLLMGVSFLILHYGALRRLLKMTAEIHWITKNHQKGSRVSLDSNKDEINQLQWTLNRMLRHLEVKSDVIQAKKLAMETLLGQIEQGVFLIQKNGLLHAEYSAYTEHIFGRQSCTNISWQDLLWDQALISEDIKALMSSAMNSILGESILNWELNCHALPCELHRNRMGQSVQVLELNYRAIWDEHDEVQGILVTVRDVSEMRILQSKLVARNEEWYLIDCILNMGASNFESFIKDSHRHLQASWKCLDKPVWTLDELHELFRHLHTLKGNARSCGFNELSALIHHAEEPVQKARNGEVSLEEAKSCRADLGEIQMQIVELEQLYRQKLLNFGTQTDVNERAYLPKSELERLIVLYQDSLSQGEDLVRWQKELQRSMRYFAEDHHDKWCAVEQNVVNRENIKPEQSLAALLGVQYISMAEQWGLLQIQLEDTALELGIAKPLWHLEGQSLWVIKEAKNTMLAVFGHILRNAYDHGLEPAEFRLTQSKEPEGQIWIKCMHRRGSHGLSQICLQIWDDGQGLDLDKLGAKAKAQGLNLEGWTDLQIADLIFNPGLSSRDQVTEISGRGVGLDVVRSEIEELGGHVELELKPLSSGKFQLIFNLYLPEHLGVLI